MSEKFWTTFWVLIAIMILGGIGTIGGCVYKSNENSTRVISEAIQKGSDPIIAKCALLLGSSNFSNTNNISSAETAICLSAANKK
jgi:hypothetical protein